MSFNPNESSKGIVKAITDKILERYKDETRFTINDLGDVWKPLPRNEVAPVFRALEKKGFILRVGTEQTVVTGKFKTLGHVIYARNPDYVKAINTGGGKRAKIPPRVTSNTRTVVVKEIPAEENYGLLIQNLSLNLGLISHAQL